MLIELIEIEKKLTFRLITFSSKKKVSFFPLESVTECNQKLNPLF